MVRGEQFVSVRKIGKILAKVSFHLFTPFLFLGRLTLLVGRLAFLLGRLTVGFDPVGESLAFCLEFGAFRFG
ncbi:MAG: hypothetical protein R6U35_03530, partial [Candidatus Humimicrobiaceae bacterium]